MAMPIDPKDMSPEQFASIQYQKEHIDEDLGPMIRGVTWAVFALSIICICLRFYAQRLVHAKFTHDDGWMIAAGIVFASFGAAATYGTITGAGKHLIAVAPEFATGGARITFAFGVLYALAILTIKTSVLLFYRRTFGVNRIFRIVVWCVLAFNIARFLASVFAQFFRCNPIQKAWNPALPGECFELSLLILPDGIVNIISDAIIVFMPIPLVRTLKLPRGRKVSICGVFALGGLVILASILRLPTVQGFSTFDYTYDTTPLFVWSVVETGVGIICGCLPLMTPLFRQVVRSSNKKPTQDSTERSWPHARIEDGHRITLQKDKFGDDIPLTDKKNLSSQNSRNVTTISYQPVNDESSSPVGRITREVDVVVETIETKR